MATPQSSLIEQVDQPQIQLSKVPYVALLGLPLIGALIQTLFIFVTVGIVIGIIFGMDWAGRIDPLNFYLSLPCIAIVYVSIYTIAFEKQIKTNPEKLIRYHLGWFLYNIVRWFCVPIALYINNPWLIMGAWYIEILMVYVIGLFTFGCRDTCRNELKNYKAQV